MIQPPPNSTLFPYTTLFRSQQATTNQNVKKRPACSELRWAYCNHKATRRTLFHVQIGRAVSRNAETDLVCRLLLEKKNTQKEVAKRKSPRLRHASTATSN